ncbi:MAG: hypothetical protein PF486_00930 [Prolixibacteraceae bacterium]|jgi:hypothetical protein|nr:hypothetical protein [Prolixibacteraceae bacterium]
MKNLKLLLVGILVSCVSLYSCNDEIIAEGEKDEVNDMHKQQCVVDSTLGITIKVQDSTLYFSEADDVVRAMKILREMPVNERISWEESVGFISSQTIIETIIDDIKAANDQEEYESIIKENAEFVKRSEDDLYGIKSRICGFYPYITSKRGFFVSESYWGRAFDKKLYACHFYDYEGYNAIKDLPYEDNISSTNVKYVQLDYTEDDNLKAYHEVHETSSTEIFLRMRNFGTNRPTKRADFHMKIINSYGVSSLSSSYSSTKYYMVVYYNGNCCSPSAYSYYYQPFGGYQRFEPYANGYRIRIPYPGYQIQWHYNMVPNWDNEVFIQEQYNVNYYNFVGRADLHTTFQAEKRNMLQNWVDFDGTVVYFKDVNAEILVGKDVSGHSSSDVVQIDDFGDNYIRKAETGDASDDQCISKIVLSEYSSKPPVVFKGCVSGELYARFCPTNPYNFSFDFD